MHRLGLLLCRQGVEVVADQMEEQSEDGHLGKQEQQWPRFFGQHHCAEVEDL